MGLGGNIYGEEMNKLKIWDKYEAALLIETFGKINEENGPRKQCLEELSNLLRRRAENLGLEIDDKFRNFNGMCLQLAAIESLLLPAKSERHCAQVFLYIIDLYKNDRKQFDRILIEAHKQAE